MANLTNEAQEQLRSIAQRYGVSVGAAENLLDALQRGSGSMAQFNHPDLGGYGQWMRGGMTMVGDMFNNGLKATVDGMCNELSRLLDNNPFVPVQQNYQGQGGGYGSANWWPYELGQATSSGAQNDMRYAYFSGPRRLAIEQNGIVTIYDTAEHQISGVSQQQGSSYSLTFSSQYGNIDLRQLRVVSSNAPAPAGNASYDAPINEVSNDAGGNSSKADNNSYAQSSAATESEQDVFAKIEKLATLRQKGVISDDEFASKKAELLARI